MPEYTGSWEESRGRISDRFDQADQRSARIEKAVEEIKGGVLKLVWIGLTAFLTLLGHAIMSYIQMGGGN